MKLYISDLDGTLLSPAGTVSDRTTQILSDCIGKGLHFTVATARTPLSALPLLEKIPIHDPMILMNGALCYNPQTKQFSNCIPFEKQSLKILSGAEQASGMEGMLFFIDHGQFSISLGKVKDCIWNGYFSMDKVAHIEAINHTVRVGSASQLQNADVVYGLYMDNEPARLEVLKNLLKDSGLTLDYYKDKYTENRWCLEICNCRATKGNALQLLRKQGYTYMIGFGDSWNDVPLFESCDEAYAVENASNQLKQMASSVIQSNADDGVANWIRRHWDCCSNS